MRSGGLIFPSAPASARCEYAKHRVRPFRSRNPPKASACYRAGALRDIQHIEVVVIPFHLGTFHRPNPSKQDLHISAITCEIGCRRLTGGTPRKRNIMASSPLAEVIFAQSLLFFLQERLEVELERLAVPTRLFFDGESSHRQGLPFSLALLPMYCTRHKPSFILSHGIQFCKEPVS